MSKLINFDENVVELILKGDESSEENFKEEMASVVRNPMVTWAKFILADDMPNKNGVVLPQSEFDNIIKSGIHMPIKMAYEDIEEDHENAYPIGVITNLKKVKNKLVGLAAFWAKERPEDIAMLKEMHEKEEPINISWEITCYEKELEDGNVEIENASLRAATIVGLPAYGGRTPILAMASKQQEEKILDELEKTKQELQTVTDERDALKTKVSELESSIEELNGLQEEVASLREFKEEIDAEREREEKMASLKKKFDEAGIEKDEEYFVENGERLLNLEPEDLDFMLQELVAFAPKTEKHASKEKLPNFTSGSNDDEKSPKELAEALMETKLKKE